ncbi:enterolysin A. metallo peptidase. MEROPS family M23B [Pediococcus acidilactici NGRI 0510Q]|nr:enterolysin A. metallo peptidase. MEROPS family M23B [Pediococcus acidilactici NGRI 0510Q]
MEHLALELPDYDHFKVYDRYLFINPYVADTQLLTVVSKEIDITNPFKSTLTIGDKTPKLTDYQNENRNISKVVSKLASTVTTISGDVSAMRGGAGNSSSQLQTIYDQLGNTNVPQLQKDVEGIQDFNQKADERLTNAETDLKTVKEDDESTKKTLDEYRQTIANLDARLRRLEGANG